MHDGALSVAARSAIIQARTKSGPAAPEGGGAERGLGNGVDEHRLGPTIGEDIEEGSEDDGSSASEGDSDSSDDTDTSEIESDQEEATVAKWLRDLDDANADVYAAYAHPLYTNGVTPSTLKTLRMSEDELDGLFDSSGIAPFVHRLTIKRALRQSYPSLICAKASKDVSPSSKGETEAIVSAVTSALRADFASSEERHAESLKAAEAEIQMLKKQVLDVTASATAKQSSGDESRSAQEKIWSPKMKAIEDTLKLSGHRRSSDPLIVLRDRSLSSPPMRAMPAARSRTGRRRLSVTMDSMDLTVLKESEPKSRAAATIQSAFRGRGRQRAFSMSRVRAQEERARQRAATMIQVS